MAVKYASGTCGTFFISILCVFFFRNNAIGQELQAGFDYLESGNYEKARAYFMNVLEDYPNNKTAKLCFGRALGLSGEAPESLVVFKELRKAYPNDFEIQLNYAEALLWNKKFTEADSVYQPLVTQNNQSFPAILGYANTLSNLKRYKEALTNLGLALALQPGNKNALVSRKYCNLGYAHQLRTDSQYEKAHERLDAILIDFPNDKDALIAKATLFSSEKKFEAAAETFMKMPQTLSDSIVALNGRSLIAHQQHKNKKALQLSNQAVYFLTALKNENELQLTTLERNVQAMLWKGHYNRAEGVIDSLAIKLPTSSRVLGMSAAHGIYTANFKKSLDAYQHMLDQDSTSFDGNLGIANAYFATSKPGSAIRFAEKTLQFYPKQNDALGLLTKIEMEHTPFIVQRSGISFDNGRNTAYMASILTTIPISFKSTLNAQYGFRTTRNSGTQDIATANSISGTYRYKHNAKFTLTSTVGLTKAKATFTDYSQLLGALQFTLKPVRFHTFEIGYKRELQDFNAALVSREIVMNHYNLNHNWSSNVNLGSYIQAMFTNQSDNNTRKLLFASLYYKILKYPMLKGGLNYQYIGFTEQVPTVYFSPEKFNLGEIFIEIQNPSTTKWIYHLLVAPGMQKIENLSASNTFRAAAKLGYSISKRLTCNAYGNYSSIASATAAGFEFTEMGIQFQWYFTRLPLFKLHP